ncbi:MAG TPA: FGGY family carbohydrate kinase [Myxococcota bacterium]|nr:FGGY family carbohydrate kinase [Myxococcota bacterium]
MTRDAVLALDLGTTSVRALVVGRDGRVLARAQRPIRAAYPQPGWSELDPEEMLLRSGDVLRESLAGASLSARDVAGLGIVTQRASALAWDARTLAPLAKAQSWQDQRTGARVAEFRKLGIPLNTLASATKFEWWLQHDDAVAGALRAGRLRLGTPDAWLAARLIAGGPHLTDPGNASCTALYDVAKAEWSQPLCDLFHVPRESLPALAPTSGVLGETHPSLLGHALPVAALAGDQQGSAFAQGVHARGQAKLTLGTSGMLDVHTGDSTVDAVPGSYPLALWTLADGTRAYCLEGTVITAGSAVDWGVELGVARDAAELSQLAESARSSGGVTFVPALLGLGTPYLDDAARGAFLGLSRGSGKAELARALLEGIAQRCADVCESLPLAAGPLRVDGGLAQSDFLLRALADFTGRDVLRAAEVESTALGAAFLAGLALGVWKDPRECLALAAPGTRVAPALAEAERAASRDAWRESLNRIRPSSGTQ